MTMRCLSCDQLDGWHVPGCQNSTATLRAERDALKARVEELEVIALRSESEQRCFEDLRTARAALTEAREALREAGLSFDDVAHSVEQGAQEGTIVDTLWLDHEGAETTLDACQRSGDAARAALRAIDTALGEP